MSLDIYAKIKRGTIPEGQQLGTAYRKWSREEKDRLTEPTKEVLHIKITHNLNKMASKVPLEWTDTQTCQYFNSDLYHVLWRPEEVFVDTVISLEMLIKPLEIGLKYLLSHEKQLSKYNPENGYGHYENFVYCLPQYIRACYKWPNAILEVDR